MVTSGATEAMAGALLALIEPGDEVVLFQPMYDAYLPLVRRAGGVPRFVSLAPPRLAHSNEAALAAAFSPRTKRRALQQPAEPGGKRLRPRGPGAARRALRRATTPSPSATRSGSMSCSTGGATSR